MLPTTVVALLAEGVDRNRNKDNHASLKAIVALLAEGVDRNNMSPSIRAFG